MLVKMVLVMSYHLFCLISAKPKTIYIGPLGKTNGRENTGENLYALVGSGSLFTVNSP